MNPGAKLPPLRAPPKRKAVRGGREVRHASGFTWVVEQRDTTLEGVHGRLLAVFGENAVQPSPPLPLLWQTRCG